MVQGQWVAAFGQGALVLLALAVPANAQVASCQTAEISQNLPPADSPPLVRCYELVFEPAGAQRLTTETYLYSIGAALQPSLRSANKWVPYQERDVLTAFERLWKTRFLEDLWVEVVDEPYENSVIGKHVIFHLEERVRVTTIEYAGSKDVPIAEIERALRDKGLFALEAVSWMSPCPTESERSSRSCTHSRAIRTQSLRSRRRSCQASQGWRE